jgi:hypothetical protein
VVGTQERSVPTMKIELFFLSLFAASAFSTFGQGTYIYDQQSATEITGGGISISIQGSQPVGQSFIPTLDSIGFVRLKGGPGYGGATLYVNLRSDTITGSILAQTESIAFPAGYFGYMEFIFATPASLTPGSTYFLQPVVEPGHDGQLTIYNNYFYANGTIYLNGIPDNSQGYDMWFQEGIVVPEPSSVWLVLVGGLGILVRRLKLKRDRGW